MVSVHFGSAAGACFFFFSSCDISTLLEALTDQAWAKVPHDCSAREIQGTKESSILFTNAGESCSYSFRGDHGKGKGMHFLVKHDFHEHIFGQRNCRLVHESLRESGRTKCTLQQPLTIMGQMAVI